MWEQVVDIKTDGLHKLTEYLNLPNGVLVRTCIYVVHGCTASTVFVPDINFVDNKFVRINPLIPN